MSIGNIYHTLDWDYYWSLPHPAFRDLAYLLNAPCLLTSCESFDAVETTTVLRWFEQYRNWIQEDALEPRRLLDFVNTPRQYKLGLYAEDLFLHFLEHQTEFELILHDQQIFNDKQCIGSMDFIIRTPDGVVEHWEMAIKFFLQRCPSTDWIDFVGPSHVDSMHRKLTKMVGRQLKLSQRPEAIDYFEANDIPVPTVHRVFSVGRFFKGYGMDFVAPEGCDLNQPTGQWIRRRDFIALFERTQSSWVVRPHPWWIGPYLTTDASELLSLDTVLHTPMERGKFLMLSQMQQVPQGWQECARWVLVVDDWGEGRE
jgi:hypothetical protein